MDEEIKELKNERKVEKNEIRQNNSKKKGLVAGVVAGGAVALALGLGLGLGLKGTQIYEVGLNSQMEGVTLTGDGEFKKGSIVTIEAEPIDGYRFTHWNFNGQTITANPYIFELTEDTAGEYIAVYEKMGPVVTVSIDGVTTEIETTEGTKLSEILSTNFSDITDYNSCGWFTTDEFIESVDLDQEILGNTSIYTKKATLDKLLFSLSTDKTFYEVEALNNKVSGEIVLPLKYNNIKVTSLKSATSTGGGFSKNTNITKFILHNEITSIGDYVFSNCTGLTKVHIPKNVTCIGNYAFNTCTNLSSVTFDKDIKLQSLNNCIFYGCSKLENIKVPSSVLSIGSSAFNKCKNLVNIEMPNTVTSIGAGAFNECTSLQSIDIPENLTYLGSHAFYDCTSLIEFNFNSIALNDLGSTDAVFYNTGKLGNGITVNIGNKVTKIPAYLFNIDSTAISYSPKIKIINFEEYSQCKNIGDFAFKNCITLEKIEIAESVTYIGMYAFAYCDKITKLTIPENVIEIGGYAFHECLGLTELNFNAIEICDFNSAYYPFGLIGTNNGVSVKIGENVKILSNYLFYNAYGIETVQISSSQIESVGEYAFAFCNNLTSITIPNSIKNIKKFAFSDCISLKDITFSENSKLEIIGSYSFADCTSLESITIPASVTCIQYQAFEGCNLKTVVFEDVDGWYYCYPQDGDAVDLTIEDLSNEATAANYLSTKYANKYWFNT